MIVLSKSNEITEEKTQQYFLRLFEANEQHKTNILGEIPTFYNLK